MTRLLSLRVEVPGDDRELVADLLWLSGALWVEEHEGGVGAGIDEPLVAGALARLDRWAAAVDEVPDGGWLDAWRAWAQPVRTGRLLVRPAWLPAADERPGDVVVELDPGRVFGHGGHPSTRLVLAELERRVGGGEAVLDVGCGSGVLAVAALRLGAATAVAVDVDPVAVEVTEDNARRNGVAHRMAASTTPVDEVEGTFDLVLANIGASVLVGLAPDLMERSRPGATLVLSGVLVDRAETVLASYPGSLVEALPTDDGWGAIVLCRH